MDIATDVPSSTAAFRLSTQDLIDEAVRLFLDIQEGENTLLEMRDKLQAPLHDIDYILQKGKTDMMKESLDRVLSGLSVLPHAPRDLEPNIRPLASWINEHRDELNALKAFCDGYRPRTRLEEGEIDTVAESLLSACQRLENRAESIASIIKVSKERLQLRVRAAKLLESNQRDLQVMTDSLGMFDFTELTGETLEMRIERRALDAARRAFDECRHDVGSK
ncbi:hypothetical protein B0H10DRAFT_1983227 [Mycena sp. CBHHK59/15]|nr:hypothetical protein B0H10DRAFT_1983227 [Mycena sp. CBHHK59/15]